MKEIISLDRKNKYIKGSQLTSIFDAQIGVHCRLFEYEKGEMICENGNRITYLFFLAEGEAKVFTTLDNGKIYLLRIEKPFSVYGDLETLTSNEYTANVEALNKCVCIGIPMSHIKENYMSHPEFLRFLCQSLANRLNKISHMSTSNLLLPLKNKLAGYLIAHKENACNTIQIESSFSDVAEQLGTTYRHLSRTMSEMISEGLIIKKGKLMEIQEIDQLEKLAGHTYRY